MKRTVAILLALCLLFIGLLGGCEQKKEVSVGTDGAISEKDASAEAPEPTVAPTPTSTPAPTEEPTPTPTEAPGWFYHYDRVLVDEEHVLFTLQTMEYNFESKTLTVIADYTNTGENNQIVVFINVDIQSVTYLLYADTADENDHMIYVQPGEKRTVTFSTELTDENLAEADLQHAATALFDLTRFEAEDPSEPNTFGIHLFDNVEVELPPNA